MMTKEPYVYRLVDLVHEYAKRNAEASIALAHAEAETEEAREERDALRAQVEVALERHGHSIANGTVAAVESVCALAASMRGRLDAPLHPLLAAGFDPEVCAALVRDLRWTLDRYGHRSDRGTVAAVESVCQQAAELRRRLDLLEAKEAAAADPDEVHAEVARGLVPSLHAEARAAAGLAADAALSDRELAVEMLDWATRKLAQPGRPRWTTYPLGHGAGVSQALLRAAGIDPDEVCVEVSDGEE